MGWLANALGLLFGATWCLADPRAGFRPDFRGED